MTSEHPARLTYVIEARDLLAQLESMLLDLEHSPSPEAIDAVFRALHTLKGGGAMFGFPVLSAFVHHLEDAFDRLREGRAALTRPLLDAVLAGRDHASALLEAGDDPGTSSNTGDGVIAALRAALDTAPVAAAPSLRQWQITFVPEATALINGMRPDLLLGELRDLGECSVSLDAARLPPLATLDPWQSHLGWTIQLWTMHPRQAIEAVFLFAADAEVSIVEAGSAPDMEEDLPSATRMPTEGRMSAERTVVPAADTVRVPAAKLDIILDQLGELVIAQARLNQIAQRLGDMTLTGLVEEVQRLVAGMRDTTLSVRMLPIETVFGKFRRVVRDLSAELGKEVAFEMAGGDTEIDKNVLDRLGGPLVHLIRNAIDHGLEPADRRKAAGKPVRGRLQLAASQDAGGIVIEIGDDGAGLDLDRIRVRAVERGLIGPDERPSDPALAQMIFAPGFSTAEQVSAVSGRGVGMDAVLTTVTALRGTVDVATSQGKGTRVTLRLPLSLAIVDGLLVRQGTDTFVLPLSVVDECAEFDLRELSRESGRSMLRIREDLVPFLDLADMLERDRSHEQRRRVVIVRADGERTGLVVDDIIGEHQTVIKQLGPFHAGIEGFSGSTILADGSVALIIDVAALLRRGRGRNPLGLAA